MSQQQSPWLETAYGWAYGENGWNTGMDSNLLKFSVMFDRNVDSITASLPPAVNGQVHYNTSDNRIYFAVNTTYFSTPVPKWFTVIVRSTGVTWQFNGTSLIQIESVASLDSRLDAVELTLSSLGSAAFEDVSAFATQAALDVVEGQAQTYTDTLRDNLQEAAGAGLIGFLQNGIGAAETTLQNKVRESVSILDFMSSAEQADSLLASPTLNHTAAIVAAMNLISSGPIRAMVIVLPGGRNYRFDSFTVRNGIELRGERLSIPDMYDTQFVTPSAIQLNLGATITLGDGSALNGVTVMPYGLTGRQDATAVTAWSGTAVTTANNGVSISNSVIFGFELGLDATSSSRLRLVDVLFDCKSGLRQSGSVDISYFTRVHCWPYTSQGPGIVAADNQRPGTGIELFDVGDWTKLTDCFTYGYQTVGIRLLRVSACTLLSCSTDNVPGLSSAAKGISIEGIGQGGEIRLVTPQCAASGVGIYIDVTGGLPTTGNVFIIQPDIWACDTAAISHNSASGLFVVGGHIRNVPNGIVLNNGSAFGHIIGVRFAQDVNGDCIQYIVPTDNFRIAACNVQGGGTGRLETLSKTAPTVIAATSLAISQWSDYIFVSGAGNVNSIVSTNSQTGRKVTLRVTTGCTFVHSANLSLKGAVNAVLTGGQSLTLVYGGNNIWREEGRNF